MSTHSMFDSSESGKSEGGGRSMVWFKTDLRTHDHEPLLTALSESSNQGVLPVYCFDPRLWGYTHAYGFPKTGAHRTRFILECVADLRQQLQTLGSDLVVRVGTPEDVLPQLAQDYGVSSVYAHREYCHEELVVEEAVRQALAEVDSTLVTLWGGSLMHMDDLPYEHPRTVPDVFTSFRKTVEAECQARAPLAVPESMPRLPDGLEAGDLPTVADLGVEDVIVDDRAAMEFVGGESNALERWDQYCWSHSVASYKDTRNGLVGSEYSTKMAPFLAQGCITPVRMEAELQKYESKHGSNESTYWVRFELLWRDYFRLVALKHGRKLFFRSGLLGVDRSWNTDEKSFRRWADGRTGIPFLDANMRELNATGWMSNRGRQNVCSFLSMSLGMDWRMGAEWFESQLLDYDPCSNYGNWQYNSAVGNDPRARVFNVVGQGKRYDAEGDFVRLWCPELKDMPAQHIHEPFKAPQSVLSAAGVHLGDSYPKKMDVPKFNYNERRGSEKRARNSNKKNNRRKGQQGKDIRGYFAGDGEDQGGSSNAGKGKGKNGRRRRTNKNLQRMDVG